MFSLYVFVSIFLRMKFTFHFEKFEDYDVTDCEWSKKSCESCERDIGSFNWTIGVQGWEPLELDQKKKIIYNFF